MNIIGDGQGFSSITPITLSRGFSVETLIEVTLSWKTESNRSISTMKDRIPRWLQHCWKACCKKDGHYERRACIIWRWYHCRDVSSGWVDLHITNMIQRRRLVLALPYYFTLSLLPLHHYYYYLCNDLKLELRLQLRQRLEEVIRDWYKW